MRRLTRFESVCLGLGVAMIAGCGGSSTPAPNDQLTITASDGKMVLTVPAGALPVGTDPSTVKVTPIPVTDFASSVSDGQIVSAYRLEPEGLKLSSPATLKVTFDPTVIKEMVGHHASAMGDEILPLKVVDRTDTALSMEAAISHFSTVGFENSAGQSQTVLTLAPPRDAFVGQPITVRYLLLPRLQGEKRDSIINDPNYVIDITWAITTTWDSIDNAASGSNVNPLWADAPDMTNLVDTTRDFDFTVTCTDAGQPYGLAFSGVVVVPTADFVYTFPAGSFRCVSGVCCSPNGTGCSAVCSSDADCMNETTTTQSPGLRLVEKGDPGSANCKMPVSDASGDFVDSVSTNTAAFTGSQVDLTAYGFSSATYTQAQVDDTFNNSVYHCGDSNATRTVVCSGGGSTPMPAGQVDTFFLKLAAPVPIADATKDYIYSVVLDSDGDPTNNWVPQASFDWDYFQGTDRWYQLVWDHTAGTWSLTATQVDATQGTSVITSTGRAVIEGDAITFFVSASELPAPTGYRVTAFGHDGMFTQSSRGGDVSGANPTEPLTALQ